MTHNKILSPQFILNFYFFIKSNGLLKSGLCLSYLSKFNSLFCLKPCLVNALRLSFFIRVHFFQVKIFHVNPNRYKC